jgi:hypothetical protein
MPRVDDRDAGAPLAHAAKPSSSSSPVVAARVQVVVRELGLVEEELRVEVAPAELPDELDRTAGVRLPRECERRDRPEVEVRAEPRRGVGGEQPAQALVRAQSAVDPVSRRSGRVGLIAIGERIAPRRPAPARARVAARADASSPSATSASTA